MILQKNYREIIETTNQAIEYAILTDEITGAWSGMSTQQYKNSGKGIYLDDGTLVGHLLPAIDSGLANYSIRARRGNR